MKSLSLPLIAAAALLGVPTSFAQSQSSSLIINVKKKDAPGKSGDKTAKTHLEIEMKNSGKDPLRGMDVRWFMVIDNEPEKKGALPKPKVITGKKEVSLLPNDTFPFNSEEVWVSKTGVGFYWNVEKREGWNPKYRGYGIIVRSGGKIIESTFSAANMKEVIEKYEANPPEKK